MSVFLQKKSRVKTRDINKLQEFSKLENLNPTEQLTIKKVTTKVSITNACETKSLNKTDVELGESLLSVNLSLRGKQAALNMKAITPGPIKREVNIVRVKTHSRSIAYYTFLVATKCTYILFRP